jgi:predicted glycoside hydrolase/deacetylase ChbG (UPF0249 family)
MLVIKADDWGRSQAETDAALKCYKEKRITSVSAMLFMADSERAAKLANDSELDVGLQEFTSQRYPEKLREYHGRMVRFLTRNKYSHLLDNPFLRRAFSYSYTAQAEEFARLYGRLPSHIDGHHHMHLCANLVWGAVIPAGTKVRRNFSFWPGEKSWFNRMYRALVDRRLSRRYQLTDYFFDLSQSIREKKLDRVMALAKSSKVELMTHPMLRLESEYLMSDEFGTMLQHLRTGSYALV